jgi:hypothetical protein
MAWCFYHNQGQLQLLLSRFNSGIVDTIGLPFRSGLCSSRPLRKICRTTVLPLALYVCVCESWSLSLCEEHNLMIFEKKMLTIFKTKTDELAQGRRHFLHDFFFRFHHKLLRRLYQKGWKSGLSRLRRR